MEPIHNAGPMTAYFANSLLPYALPEHIRYPAPGVALNSLCLKRVVLYAAPLTNPADVAWFLAFYARDAKACMGDTDLPALTAVCTALEQALGVTFEGRKGEHFFRSTLLQTLFYGISSAWVLWSKKRAPGNIPETFDWRTTPWERHVPLQYGLLALGFPAHLRPGTNPRTPLIHHLE